VAAVPIASQKKTAYAVYMKETYENMEILLDKINYDKHRWNICGALKIVTILLANPIWIYSLLANGIAEPSTSTTQ
jgi:hypothetical protein